MDIVKNKMKYRILSLAIMLIGLVMYLVSGFNYGIDFTGGTVIEIAVGEELAVDEVRKLVEEFDEDISIIHSGENKEGLIIKSTLDFTNEEVLQITKKFEDEYGIDRKNVSAQKIGPSMGNEIRNKALISIGVSSLAMLAYITVRFELKFGLASIIALLHDILITVAIYAIFKLPINSSFIAAILTIVGYSINDTIVIFDRIREEKRLNARTTPDVIISDSIKHSLRRTINTSITTILSVVILYIVGVEEVKILALPLIMGMLAGTYSSIFIAPNIWYDLNKF